MSLLGHGLLRSGWAKPRMLLHFARDSAKILEAMAVGKKKECFKGFRVVTASRMFPLSITDVSASRSHLVLHLVLPQKWVVVGSSRPWSDLRSIGFRPDHR